MSTKSLTWGLFGTGGASVRDETKESSRAAHPLNRKAMVLSRPGTRSRSSAHGISWSRGELKTRLALALAGAVVVLSLLYVFGINQSAAKGYEITAQKNRLNTLMEDNKKLLVRTAQAGSVRQIQDEALANQLVQITVQEYLQQPTQLSQR
jgi:hypothetical protein